MNCIEHHLPELELATGQVREALQAILHTILFIRSPISVTPTDVHCEGFNMSYTRIANTAPQQHHPQHSQFHHRHHQPQPPPQQQRHFLDEKVNDSIESFLTKLTQIGPELLSGCLTLSFFERRTSKQLFGLVSQEQKIIWEQWVLHIVVNNTPRPVNDDTTSVMERQRIQHTAEMMLRSVLYKIYDLASSGGGGGGKASSSSTCSSSGSSSMDSGVTDELNHIPPVKYEFDIQCTKKINDRETVYSRVAHMPSLLNLDG